MWPMDFTVSPPNRDKLTMRAKPLKTRDLILSLSKDEAKILCFFSSLLDVNSQLLELAIELTSHCGNDQRGADFPRVSAISP